MPIYSVSNSDLFSISGMKIIDARIDYYVPQIECTVLGSGAVHYESGPLEVTGDFSLWVENDNCDIIDFLQSRLGDSVQYRSLGVGNRCQYCGTVWLPGTLKCMSCGGELRSEPRVMEWTSDALMYHFNVKSLYDGFWAIDISMRYETWAWGGVKSKWKDWLYHGLFGKPGDWLCPYCGFYCQGPVSKCPGCGGNRLPIDQLSQLERLCVYCGKTTIGGFACKECNQRLTNGKVL